jgi:ABC-2 type transport system ATP-binding protein
MSGHTIVLQAEGLTKRYGALTAVDRLSLEVHQGEVFGLLGPNGAGKTTSINMMCGLLRPDEGRVLVHGRPIHSGDPDVRARVGVCPQEIILWSHLTCLEQLRFIGEMYDVPGRIARQRGERLLDEMGLAEKRHKQARTLSSGMQRRLNLAMALVHDPDIAVLDEPEAGLDPQSRVAVRDTIRQLAQRKTVILTTHNMDEAQRLADRVAIIDHGRLLVLDTPESLKRSVGEGDVLEIGLEGDDDCRRRALEALSVLDDQARIGVGASALHVRALNAVSLLPEILERLKAASVPLGEVRLRENTLEDVFIQLTGRRLRE